MTIDNPEARILIIDDEESIRMTFQMFLAREGYGTVVTAATIAEAEAVLARQSFDLIISDIVLEGGSGTDILRKVRRAGINCPVVMVTGFPNLESAAEAVRLGAFDYIPKPVNKDVLLRFTRQALRHWFLEKENARYRRYLEAVFRSVRDAIIAVDRDLRIVQLNETAWGWLGLGEDETMAGRKLKSLAGELGRVFFDDARQVLQSKREVREHRVECEGLDGDQSIFSLNASPLQDDEGLFQGVVLVARDISVAGRMDQGGGRRSRFHGYVDSSLAMQGVYNLIENVGKVDTSVLIVGESGTGKELAAQALHAESGRCDFPLIKVDCASIPEDLLESELFGHRKGAFTGADRDRDGRIMQAAGGTLFLDEIGDMSSRMQLRLLRFLQERTFYPVGRDMPVQVDVRVVAATNVDLAQKVREGGFRQDLYYRLRVVEIKLPPLRQRREGIPLLVSHFLVRFREKLGREINGISDQAMAVLKNYSWPGNVRELQHVIERACVLCQGTTLALGDLPREVQTGSSAISDVGADVFDGQKGVEAIAGEGADAIVRALRRTGGNKARAARLLGVNRSTLYRRMARYGINIDQENL